MSSRNRLAGGSININTSEDSDRDDQDIAIGIESASDQQPGSLKKIPLHRRMISGQYRRGSRFSQRLTHGGDLDELEDKQPRRSFCRSWCEMWFLLAQSKITCIGLSLVLFGGGIFLTLLTYFGDLMECTSLNGAAVFCFLISVLSFSLGLLCCTYHWVQDDDDLPFALFCVAYCLLLLFMFVTIAGTVVVFTRIHPVGHLQPPPGVPFPSQHFNGTSVDGKCDLIELPLGVLIICYGLSLGFVIMSYVACILALGATSDIPPL